MSNVIPPNPEDLPSLASLRKATVIAVAIAIILCVTVVLPAEWGIDPTGLGATTGFQEMGAMKVDFAKEFAEQDAERELLRLADSADVAESTAMVRDSSEPRGTVPPGSLLGRSDIMTIAVPAAGGAEMLLEMQKGAHVRYSWSTDGEPVDYATQGDSLGLGARIYSRKFATKSRVGVIVAAFDGNHGWYWRNTTNAVVTIKLQTSGVYQLVTKVVK